MSKLWATFKNQSFKAHAQLIVVMAFLILAFLFSQRTNETPDIGADRPTNNKAMLVETIDIAPVTDTVKLDKTGTVAVRNFITIVPQVSGRVVYVNEEFKAGGAFKANEPLFRIEQADFINNVERLKASVEQAETNLALQRAEADAAVEEFNALYGDDESVPALVARAPQMEQARAELNAAKAQLSDARLGLKRTTYTLPYAGRVAETSIEVGQYVQAAQSYGRLYSNDSLEVTVPVEDNVLQWVTPGETKAVLTTNYRGAERTIDGVISRVSGELDADTRFSTLIVTPINDDWAQLVPGIFVDITITGPVMDDLWHIPNSVIQEQQSLWRVNDDNTLTAIKPTVLSVRGDTTAAKGNGDTITVVNGTIEGAYEGMTVRMVNANDDKQYNNKEGGEPPLKDTARGSE